MLFRGSFEQAYNLPGGNGGTERVGALGHHPAQFYCSRGNVQNPWKCKGQAGPAGCTGLQSGSVGVWGPRQVPQKCGRVGAQAGARAAPVCSERGRDLWAAVQGSGWRQAAVGSGSLCRALDAQGRLTLTQGPGPTRNKGDPRRPYFEGVTQDSEVGTARPRDRAAQNFCRTLRSLQGPERVPPPRERTV